MSSPVDWQTRAAELLQFRLFALGENDVTVGSLVAIVLVLMVTAGVARALRPMVAHRYRRRGIEDSVALGTTAAVLQIVVWLVGVELVLHILGIRLATLFATTGFLAFGAGFGLKSVVENWLGGVILRVGQTIRPGDIVVVDGQWLRIQSIGPRTTDALTYSNEEVMIPNSLITQSRITNLTRHDRLYRLEAKVGVAYDSDLDLVRNTLESTLRGLEWRSSQKDPAVYLKRFGESSVEYVSHVWIDDVRHTLKPASDLHEAIWTGLRKAGVVIAYPQLDVHLDHPPQGEAD